MRHPQCCPELPRGRWVQVREGDCHDDIEIARAMLAMIWRAEALASASASHGMYSQDLSDHHEMLMLVKPADGAGDGWRGHEVHEVHMQLCKQLPVEKAPRLRCRAVAPAPKKGLECRRIRSDTPSPPGAEATLRADLQGPLAGPASQPVTCGCLRGPLPVW